MDRHLLLPAQMPLKEHRQVVSQRGQTQRRGRRPELLQAQCRQGKTRLEFLDDILAVRPAILVTPHRQRRVRRRWQTRPAGNLWIRVVQLATKAIYWLIPKLHFPLTVTVLPKSCPEAQLLNQ